MSYIKFERSLIKEGAFILEKSKTVTAKDYALIKMPLWVFYIVKVVR